ncbi:MULTISPECIES: hypothetical protein [unclassified Streptomyces]|uniref:hypothetical protein n=1 Tax=unclassified Streptomyces TaxID=2593676 RepID=UPI00224CC699|nr:hypothetical protein [Streptomyces sp. NBC_00620]MCX4976292.1 hypothetical protein [Streptomyces sp. NBC_00620]WTB42733.1 hypothetical protein OG569_34440 [Streptomyces sp. NBC_00827]
MLRITDVRTGEPTDAVRARRALARVRVHVPTADTSALRVLLVADVLARALEIGGTPAVTAADPPEELRVRADALGIRRAEAGTAGAGPALHVLVQGDTAPEDDIRIEVAPVTGTADPALLRMILLATPRREPVDLATADLEGARETLARWRKAVATWATRPSKPVPEAVRQELRAAWEDDLDVPAVLEVLRRVESDEGIPDGARFETYAYADRLLGLELTRDIGSVR